jgi:hypothetical protein
VTTWLDRKAFFCIFLSLSRAQTLGRDFEHLAALESKSTLFNWVTEFIILCKYADASCSLASCGGGSDRSVDHLGISRALSRALRYQ